LQIPSTPLSALPDTKVLTDTLVQWIALKSSGLIAMYRIRVLPTISITQGWPEPIIEQ